MYELSFVIKVVGYNQASNSSTERDNTSVAVDKEHGNDIPYFRILMNKMDETTSIFDIRNDWNEFKTTSDWMEIRYSNQIINHLILLCNI